jgi:HAD superfamily hydrolase (TIGR01509 family)
VSVKRFDAVIFDMDGTLIEPLLDFAAIRAELDIPPERGIVEAIAAMPPPRAAEANRRLLERERSAAREAELMPGAAEALQAVRHAGLKTALLTRNAREAMEIVLGRFETLRFDLAWSREAGPIKPEPDGILRACRELGTAPRRTACVGDFRYDVLAANAAGAVSVLLARGGPPGFADEADYVIASLDELKDVLGI